MNLVNPTILELDTALKLMVKAKLRAYIDQNEDCQILHSIAVLRLWK